MAERSIKYKGTINIKLNVLHFPYEESKELDKNNVERLKNLFRNKSNCRKLNLWNYIPAVISQAQLTAVITAFRTSVARFLDDTYNSYSKLNFPFEYRLLCFHGRY